jgi:hypothetical protein
MNKRNFFKKTYNVHWLDHPHSLSPHNALLTPLKTIARGFFFLFHIWSPSTMYPHFKLLRWPFPSHKYLPTHTPCTISQSCLSWCSKGCLNASHCGCALLRSLQPLLLPSLTPLPPPPIFQQLSVHIFISSIFTDPKFYKIDDALSGIILYIVSSMLLCFQ